MRFPYVRTSSSHPASAPGTVTDSTPRCVPDTNPRAASVSRVMREPARPLALSATSFRSFASHTMANMSPPIPVMCGSVTLSTAAAVTAASIAFPPCCSTSSAADDASGWLVATIPCGAYTTDRPAMRERTLRGHACGAPAPPTSSR